MCEPYHIEGCMVCFSKESMKMFGDVAYFDRNHSVHT